MGDNVLNMDKGERSQPSMEMQLKIIKIQLKHNTVNGQWFFPVWSYISEPQADSKTMTNINVWKMSSKNKKLESEKGSNRGSLSVTIPDCNTGSVTKIVCRGRRERGEKGGLTSAWTDNASKAAGQH